MDKELLAWMAGFLDGEGCFTFFKDSKIKTSGAINSQYYAVIMTSQAIKPHCIETMNLFQDNFGGYLRIREQKEKHKNWKDVCVWRITSQKARKVCELLLPYLKIKKRQAEILIEYQKTAENQNWRIGLPFDKKSLPIELIERREKMVTEIRELNMTGK